MGTGASSAYIRKKCPICGKIISGEVITYKSRALCPGKWINKMIHIKCAEKEKLPIPRANEHA